MKLKTIFKQVIVETIRSAEANRDETGVQTVIDGKRGLGFMTIRGSTMPKEEFWDKVKQSNLNILPVDGNQFEAYIYYRDGFEQDAKELKSIAEKYGGFLSYEATASETRRIGELLGYDKDDIDEFISTHYPNET